jgi:flagellar protein FliS
MWQNGHDAYLESRILSADPIELVNLLYQACTGAVREARHHLAAGDIAARSRSISKASEILVELTSSLDHERGGEISQRLGQLYDYMLRRLTEGNFQQSDAPLAEVLGLLSTLTEAWEGLKSKEKPAVVAASPWGQALPQETASAGAAQAWSF